MVARIRVLKCILDDRFGGPHRRSYALAERLRDEGIETVFLFGSKGDDPTQRCGGESLSLGHLQFMRRRHAVANLLVFLLFLPLNLVRIRRIIASRGIDIVDIDGASNVLPALVAAYRRIPIVWCYNDLLPGPTRHLLLPLVARLSSTVVVQGEKLRALRIGSRVKLGSKAVVLYPGIDTRKFDPARYDARARKKLKDQFDVPSDCPLIGMVGNMNPFKGHKYFLKAASRIKEAVPNAKFIVVGRKLDTYARYWRQLQSLTANLDLKDDVIYAGFRDDVPSILSVLDVFVLPSIRESCPNAVLEALAMKVPVVATDVGAVSELVIDGQTGILVRPGDPQAMAEAVLRYLQKNPQANEEYLKKARERVERVFSLGSIVEQQKRIYESVLTRHREGDDRRVDGKHLERDRRA
jgi:glycosyltransferase involved in cell wall biosynthesis